MEKDLVLFSSDSSDLYKWDIFKSLVLPNKYVIHYRYKKIYITTNIISEYKNLINKDGIIFFAKGNDLKIPKDERNVELISIRRVIIKDISEDNKTNSLNFYLELGEFCDCSPIDGTDATELPPNHFVTLINLCEGPNPEWIKRVQAIQDDFPGTIFYLINALKHKDEEIKPNYSSETKRTYYNISDEDNYVMNISIFNPTRENIRLNSTSRSDLIETTISDTETPVASIDTKEEIITTHSLTQKCALEWLRISQKNFSEKKESESTHQSNSQVEIWFNIKRKRTKVQLFGFLSALAATGVLGTTIATRNPPLFDGMWPWVITAGSILLIGVVAARFFDLFNKK